MIEAIVQSTIILSLSLCAVLLLRGRSAALRHAVLAAGLVTSLAVPFLSRFMPLEFAVPRQLQGFVQVTEMIWISDDNAAFVAASKAPPAASRTTPSIVWIWYAGMAAVGSLLLATTARILRLRFQSTPVAAGEWLFASRELSKKLGLRRRVRLVQNNRAMLGTWGTLRPTVFLPCDSQNWPADRIRVVLTHELAHIKRFDWPVQFLAEIALAVYWFNPLFWLACRWLKSESEYACDDVVLNSGIDARDYAAQLLSLARALNNSERDWMPILAMSRQPNLERRFVAMLNASLNHRSLNRYAVFSIWLVALCVTLALAAMRAPAQAKPVLPSPPPPVRAVSTAPKPLSSVATKPIAAKPARVQGLADGTLAGAVGDASGARVPGVAVKVASIDLPRRIEMETITSDVGQFEFRGLAPGLYALTAELPGFTPARIGGIQIQSSQTAQRNVTLQVGSVYQRVEVSVAGQPKPPAPVTNPQRVRVGGLVGAANLISQVKPVYPESAREEGREGTVRLQGVIDVDGNLIALHPLTNLSPDLTNAALEAARQWRYRPASLNGEPVQVQTVIEVEFKIAQ
jgi:TonB family protein